VNVLGGTVEAVPQRRLGDHPPGVRAETHDGLPRLRGEPPIDSATLEEAKLWIDVYTETSMFWQQMARHLDVWLEEVTSDRARQELQGIDGQLIQARCTVLRRRLHLWELRAREFGRQS
jgi:hypothetical protein